MLTKSLSFYLSGIALISPSFLKDSFAAYKILDGQFFLWALEYFSTLPLTSKVSNEKSSDNLIEEYLYVIIHFYPAAFKILCLLKVWLWYLRMRLFELIFKFILNIYIYVFQQIWKVFSHYFFKFSLCSLYSLSHTHLILGLPQCIFSFF